MSGGLRLDQLHFSSSCQWRDLFKYRVTEIANGGQAAQSVFHNSVIVVLDPPSSPILNCPSLTLPAGSIPEIGTNASANRLNPGFTLRRPSSTRLFKYWMDRTWTRHPVSGLSASLASPGGAPHSSLRFRLREKSTVVWPAQSMAPYRYTRCP